VDETRHFLTLAGRLKWLRRQAGLTQTRLAALCGVTKAYISRLESGQRRTPSQTFLLACASALSVPLDWLQRGTGPVPLARPPGPTATSRDDLRAFSCLLFQVAPPRPDQFLRLTAAILDSPNLTDPFKHSALLAAHLAFHVKPGTGSTATHPPPAK
jgi:transcriptional regulator with XRE-family HTH domain